MEEVTNNTRQNNKHVHITTRVHTRRIHLGTTRVTSAPRCPVLRYNVQQERGKIGLRVARKMPVTTYTLHKQACNTIRHDDPRQIDPTMESVLLLHTMHRDSAKEAGKTSPDTKSLCQDQVKRILQQVPRAAARRLVFQEFEIAFMMTLACQSISIAWCQHQCRAMGDSICHLARTCSFCTKNVSLSTDQLKPSHMLVIESTSGCGIDSVVLHDDAMLQIRMGFRGPRHSSNVSPSYSSCHTPPTLTAPQR